MKKIISVLFVLISIAMNAQDFEKNWMKVYEFEYAGKIKSASAEVNKIYAKARKNNNQPQIIKTFIYQSKFLQTLEEEAQYKIIQNLKKEIKTKDETSKAIFHYLYATFISEYYQQFRYISRNKTATDTIYNTDFRTWSYATFDSEIENSLEKSIENEEILLNTPLKKYEEIIDINKYETELNLSLYDFLAENFINKKESSVGMYEDGNSYLEEHITDLYGNTDTFQKLDFSNLIKSDFYKKLLIYQKLEKNYAFRNNNLALYHTILKRITTVYETKLDHKQFLRALETFSKNGDESYKNAYVLKLAQVYTNNASKNVNTNYNKKAMVLLDEIISKKQEPFVTKAAEVKRSILQKYINVKTEKYLISNQKNRALVSYANIDTIFGSIYRIPNNFDSDESGSGFHNRKKGKYIDLDSLNIDYANKHKPYKTFISILPNKSDNFNYSTEIIFPELETGTYLLMIALNKDVVTENSIYAYETIVATDLAISSITLKDSVEIQVVNRKTGKPIENAILKSNEFTLKTKNDGKIAFSSEGINSATIQVIHQNDTISHSYWINKYTGNNENQNSKGKVDFFTDRSIYRPGQTVYFKGIFTQLKQEKTNIVPNVFVNVIVKDANSQEIFKTRLQSNEFGSFAGEFVIPKNVLTGSFQINATRDNDYKNDELYDKKTAYHPLWDDLKNFITNPLYFQVEEYKRPKFEISFDPITENFKVNQNIKIKGIAKAYAGSNITNAKVSYTIERTSSYQNWHYPKYYNDDDTHIKEGETKTDENGKFEIDFTAIPSENSDEKGLPVFNYKILAEITDSNGETRTKSALVKVGYHSLTLSAYVLRNIDAETPEEIKIDSKNLNAQFVPVKGEIKIYKLKSPDRVLRSRSWDAPEIQTISEDEFKKVFASEPYSNENTLDKWELGPLVFSKKVDTKITKNIQLDNLKKWASGEYRVLFTAKDAFGKDIEVTSSFNLTNKEDKKLADSQLFKFKVINENIKKDGFVELQFSSATSQLYISTDVFYRNENIFNKVIEVIDGKKTIKIPVEKRGNGEVKINMSYVWENQEFHETASCFLYEDKEIISIETSSIRNKIEPGSSETWSFSIKDQNKKGIATEALATMYDASLDEFTKATWKTDLNFQTNTYSYSPARNFSGFENSFLDFNNLDQNFNTHFLKNTEFNWFGFDFLHQNNQSDDYQKFLIDKLVVKRGQKVYGYVTESGIPLPGVSVVVSRTQRATTTDAEGYFEIKALLGEILEFNFAGFKEHFGFVNGDVITIDMKEPPSSLQEIAVIGYQSIAKKTNLTYSVTSFSQEVILDNTASEVKVDAEIIEEDADTVFSARLAGSVPGIAIRGISSIDTSKEVLYIIDGTEITAADFEKLNAEDIQNITVLKNDTATSIYGNRGKNGVIIILTKKGIAELSKVKARKNLSETAFFLPQLTTDAKGNLKFNFTSPQALTKWKLRILAHNKKAVSGYFENNIITQKDLMVLPNMPLFLREKDSITITSKISNLTPEAKSGIAMLQLFDATTMEAADLKMNNTANIKNFNINANGNTTVSWKIYIPEGLQGVQYKIVAKAGNFTDGEENILPILTNNMLVTESIPLWVRENTTKEFKFENLKNNTSSTLRNQQLTLEYTSNPTWLAIQSLPYLMEYEHECAEQTFARYYANALASEILNSNPKIAEVFESWKKSEKPVSKLAQNEELKSILLAETPWLADSQTEEEKKKNLALLFDLDKMKDSQKAVWEKLVQKQKPSGGFAWFDNGEESEYITRHILSGLGHLRKLTHKKTDDLDQTSKKALDFLDQKFLDNHILTEKKENQTKLIWKNPYQNLHYLYARSLYFDCYPMGKNLERVTALYIKEIEKNWLHYSLYEKAMASLVLSRFGDKENAKKIIESLRQTASTNEEWGMYWIENKSGWYWYEAPIETQALIIEAFAEIDNDKKSVEAMKVWLLKNKQAKNWPTTKATTEAVYALLMQGNDWISLKDKTTFKIGDEKVVVKKLAENEKEAGTGYINLNWKADEITKDMATLSIKNNSEVPGFGGFYWQYFEELDKIKSSQESPMQVEKELYLKANTSEGKQLQRITDKKPLKIGDLVTVRLIISSKEDMEFVHLKDMRASCFEPIDVISAYKWQDGLGFYQSTKDAATHFFFDHIKKGKFVLEYDIRVNNLGDFSNGITTIQSMYAPEFSSHSKGIRVKIKE